MKAKEWKLGDCYFAVGKNIMNTKKGNPVALFLPVKGNSATPTWQ
jgi:hypothetical protein